MFSLVSSQLIYKSGDPIELKIPCFIDNAPCSVSATCNITILYPNSSSLISNQGMTNLDDGFFLYNLDEGDTVINGAYRTTVSCLDTGENGYITFDYEITTNGKESPEGVVIVTFSIFFLLFLAGLVGLMLYTIGRVVDQSFNLWDLIFNISSYIVLFGVYYLGGEYLGNSFINEFLLWALGAMALTNVVFPLIAFILSITVWRLKELNSW